MNNKILHISSSNGGGAGKAALRLHFALLNNGVDSSFLALNSTAQKRDQICFFDGIVAKHLKAPEQVTLTLKNYLKERFFKEYEKKIAHFKNQKNDIERRRNEVIEDEKNHKFELFSSPFSDYDITTCSAYKNADIIHLHWVAGFLDYPSFFKKNKKPIIWTLHDENPFRGGFHYFGDEIRNRFSYGVRDDEYKKVKFNSISQQQILSIVSPSVWLAEEARKSHVFKSRKIKTISNTLDTSIYKPIDKLFARQFWGIPEDVTVFMFASQYVENKRKGFDLLWPIIEKSNFKNVFYLIVGTNVDLGNCENVIYTGSISDDRLMALTYSAADFFILPSREDNLPNTMVEALCCGTPVIGFDIGDNKSLITNNNLGIICEEISTDALLISMSKAIESKRTFSTVEISIKAHSFFNSSYIVELYIEEYKSLI